MNTQTHTPATPLTEDDIRDIAIKVVDLLVLKGHVPNCTDTDNPAEFEVQDTIVEALMDLFS